MKKKIISLLVVALCFVGFTNVVNAEIEANDLKATLQDEINNYKGEESYKEYIDKFEAIDPSLYKASDDKINVYIFRGSTCGYCLRAINFISDILPEYGKYFNLVTYEVWSNEDNADLMTNVASALDKEVEGVPLIVIGDQVFDGYTNSYDEDIKAAIKDSYDHKDNGYEDVVDSVINGKSINKKSSDGNSTAVTIIILLIVVAGVFFLIYMAKDDTLEEKKEDEESEKNVSEPKKTSTKVSSTTTKKSTTAKTTTPKKATAKKSTSAKTTTAKKAGTTKKTSTKKTTTKK